MRYFLAAVLFTILFFVGSLLVKLGAFKPVVLRVSEEGPYVVLYKEHMGPYHKVNDDITEVETWARANGEKCELSFGQYLDNPKTDEELRLRANVGCIIEKKPTVALPQNYLVMEIPKRQYIVAVFEGSPAIGPQKVYPKINDYAEEARLTLDGPVLETYRINDGSQVTTTYYFPAKNK